MLPHAIPAGIRSWRTPRGEEEFPVGVLTELVAEDAETAGGIAEALGRPGGGEALHEEGAEGLVLAMDKVLWFQEEGAEVC